MIRINIENTQNFYSEQLNGTFHQLYLDCVNNLANGIFRTSAILEMNEESQRNIEKVVEAIIYGCPELFFIEQSIRTSWTGNQITLEFSNKYSGENINELWNQLNTELDRISAIVNKFEKTYDKINRINQYLCARVEPIISRQDRYGDAYGALIRKEARCEGSAKAA